MRHAPLLAAAASLAVLAGCAKSADKAATDTAAPATAATAPPPLPKTISLADVAGKWSMRSIPESGDTTATTYTLNATADTTGWTITFPNGKPIPVRVTVSGDSVITDAGPYASVRRKGVMVHTVGALRLEGTRAVGHTTAHYKTTGPDSVLQLRTEGTKMQ